MDTNKKTSKPVLLINILIFVLAFSLYEFIIPQRHEVFYDEFYFLNIAQNIHHSRLFASTSVGDRTHPQEFTPSMMRPAGFPFLLAGVFGLFGDSEKTVFQFNGFLSSISVLLMFWAGFLFFHKNILIGLFSALIFAALPPFLRYAGSGVSDIALICFVLFGVLFLLLYVHKRKIPYVYLSCFTFALSCYIKPEGFLAYVLAVIFISMMWKNRVIDEDNAVSSMFFSFIALLPLLAQVPSMVKIEYDRANGLFLSLRHLFYNAVPNLFYLFDFRFFSSVATILFLAGSFYLFRKDRKKGLLLIAGFFLFYLTTTAYFQGRYSRIFFADSDRHFLLAAIPFSLLAAYGLFVVLNLRVASGIKAFLLPSILILLTVNSASATRRLIDMTYQRPAYKIYQFVKEEAVKLPKDLPILCYEPFSIIPYIPQKAVKIFNFFNAEAYPAVLILLKDYWWHEFRGQTALFEEALKEKYDFKTIAEKQIDAETSAGFYLLTTLTS